MALAAVDILEVEVFQIWHSENLCQALCIGSITHQFWWARPIFKVMGELKKYEKTQ